MATPSKTLIVVDWKVKKEYKCSQNIFVCAWWHIHQYQHKCSCGRRILDNNEMVVFIGLFFSHKKAWSTLSEFTIEVAICPILHLHSFLQDFDQIFDSFSATILDPKYVICQLTPMSRWNFQIWTLPPYHHTPHTWLQVHSRYPWQFFFIFWFLFVSVWWCLEQRCLFDVKHSVYLIWFAYFHQ